MAKSKKDNINSFSGMFLGTMQPEKTLEAQTTQEPIQKEKATGEKIFVTPKEKEETRSKRVQLLIKPSVYVTAKKQCDSINISLNECINQLLENWILAKK